MDLEEVIKTRRSIRKYQDKDVPIDLILEAIALATWAPNGGNFQPWTFVVVRKSHLIQQVARLVQQKVDMIAAWPEAAPLAETMERYQRLAGFFQSAPVLIGMTMRTYQSGPDRVLQERAKWDEEAAEMVRNRATVSTRVQTISAAITILLLALHNMGLGACWMTGPMLAKREIEQLLELRGDEELFALMPVGFPDEEPVPPPRKPLGDVVRIIEQGD
ncbi:MAG: nitroreductase [Planctomycetaceae bacterium]|nr:MAG: nitroreductase [Planctomycetaceae bacterium]